MREREDAVEMIGHDDEGVEFQAGEAIWKRQPLRSGNFAKGSELNSAACHFTEKIGVIHRTHRHEIGSGSRIVVPCETEGFPLGQIGEIVHEVDPGGASLAPT